MALQKSIGHRVMRILVESAAIYAICHLLYAVLYAVKSNIEATPGYLVSHTYSESSIAHAKYFIYRKRVLRVSLVA